MNTKDFSKVKIGKVPLLIHLAAWGLLVCVPAYYLWPSMVDVFAEARDLAHGSLLMMVFGNLLLLCIVVVATSKVKRRALGLTVVSGLLLAGNYAGHWLMKRDLATARVAVAQKEAKLTLDSRLKTEEAERQAKLLDSAAKYNATAAVADRAAIEVSRRNGTRAIAPRKPIELNLTSLTSGQMSATPTPTPSSAMSLLAPAPEEKTAVSYESPEQVYMGWKNWLAFTAIFELLVTLGGIAWLVASWEWDLNGNGIADHLETQPGN